MHPVRPFHDHATYTRAAANQQHVTNPPSNKKNFLVVDQKTETAAIEEAFDSFTERKDIGIVLINQHVRPSLPIPLLLFSSLLGEYTYLLPSPSQRTMNRHPSPTPHPPRNKLELITNAQPPSRSPRRSATASTRTRPPSPPSSRSPARTTPTIPRRTASCAACGASLASKQKLRRRRRKRKIKGTGEVRLRRVRGGKSSGKAGRKREEQGRPPPSLGSVYYKESIAVVLCCCI